MRVSEFSVTSKYICRTRKLYPYCALNTVAGWSNIKYAPTKLVTVGYSMDY